jgi:triphosphatase
VHQMRVALRRLRTACALIGTEIASPTLLGFAAEAKWMAQVLGGAREWDVLVTDTLRRPSRAMGDAAGHATDAAMAGTAIDFEGLREAAEPHRLAAYDVLQATLAGTRYNRFNLSLRRCVECRGWRNEMVGGSLAVLVAPARSMADRLLTRLHRQALKRGAGFRHMQPEARHRLRITLKRLRYALEFFRDVYDADGKTKAFIASLATLQDALGHANDAAMTQPLLSILAHDSVTPDVHRAIGALIGWQARDGVEVDKTLRKHWRQFKVLPVFWSEQSSAAARS